MKNPIIDYKGLARFEAVAARFLQLNEEQQAQIVAMFPEAERKTFLEGVGMYHLFTDETFYKAIETTVGEQLYADLRAEVKYGQGD